jgi:hypothetical protein
MNTLLLKKPKGKDGCLELIITDWVIFAHVSLDSEGSKKGVNALDKS